MLFSHSTFPAAIHYSFSVFDKMIWPLVLLYSSTDVCLCCCQGFERLGLCWVCVLYSGGGTMTTTTATTTNVANKSLSGFSDNERVIQEESSTLLVAQ